MVIIVKKTLYAQWIFREGPNQIGESVSEEFEDILLTISFIAS